MAQKLIRAEQARSSALVFNLASMAASIVVPLLMIWIAASIFVYAAIAHHPNPRTVYYNRIAGYRFYGAAGVLLVFGQPLYSYFGGWRALVGLWVLLLLATVPLGIRDWLRVRREAWQDMTIEVSDE